MSVLHAYFHLRKQNEFQRCLEQAKTTTANSNMGQVSSSGGSGPTSRSWTKLSALSGQAIDVNTRDWLGRTVLHLACSALDPAALEFARLLLAHPYINVNIQDRESHWTPLHRALYAGNVSAAVLLVQRSDTDMFMKDVEGYTPFDLYNSTVEGTNPPKSITGVPSAELYTWGSNRNATLGLGDDNDRSLPEQVIIRRDDGQSSSSLCDRLKALSVSGISMSKMHTTIITRETRNNLRSCGFASDGRLGPAATTSHAQFSLINPQKSLSHAIVSVALGQDHTLAITSSGEILSWGLNRFSQLGYVMEGNDRTLESQIQASARKITGPLRNQVVIGVACCKTASACWTSKQLYTWGTNGGQLGYEKMSQPQVIPRLVPYINELVLAVAMTDSAMLVLLATREVICVHDGAYWKLQFTIQRRASKPINKERVEIQKVAAYEGSVGSFALVSEIGDVYLFNVEDTPSQKKEPSEKGGSRRPAPQLVWAVRRQFLAVRDIALGSDGSMILCTTSGHVFIRSRMSRSGINLATGLPSHPPKGSSSFKVQRVPNLQRIYHVAANNTGAFAALRLDAVPERIQLDSHTVSSELDQIQPYRSLLRAIPSQLGTAKEEVRSDEETLEQSESLININDDDEVFDVDIAPDIRSAMEMCRFLTHASSIAPSSNKTLQLSEHYGGNVQFKVGSLTILLHRSVLLARVPALNSVLSGGHLQCGDEQAAKFPLTFDGKGNSKTGKYFTIVVRGCLPMTMLILCHYLYTDKVVAVWDRRVALAISDRYGNLKINILTVKDQLRRLASSTCLQLPSLETAAQSAGRVFATPSLSQDFARFFNQAQRGGNHNHDVKIILRDRQIKAHSSILRARSPYFATFFDEECWTRERLAKGGGMIEVDLSQFDYRPISYLFRYLYGDVSTEIFNDIDFIHSTDQLVDFMFEIISCSNHLLLDGFTKICSLVILEVIDLSNVSSILVDAVHFNAMALVNSVHGYMAKNLETLMEMHALDELPLDVLKQFSTYIRGKQADFHPYIRNGGNIARLEKRWESWLVLQDIPTSFVPKYLSNGLRAPLTREVGPRPSDCEQPSSSPPNRKRSTQPVKIESGHLEDDIFPMDGDLPASITNLSSSPSTSRVWKSASVSQKIDMRSIMEAEKMASTANKSQRSAVISIGHSPTTKGPMKPSIQPNQSPQTLQRLPSSQRTSQIANAGASTSPQQSTLVTPTKSTSTRPASSPWNVPVNPSPQPFAKGNAQPQPSTPINSSMDVSCKRSPTKASPTKPEHGPLIVPTKLKPSVNAPMRRSSSGEGPAWSNSAPHIIPPRTSTVQAPSFLAIQEQQAVKPPPRGPPKSLREIQEEEQETAFLTWFEEESARLQKQEADMLATALAEEQPKGQRGRGGKSGHGKRPRGEQGGRGQGRGRGRGRGREHQSPSTLVS